MWWREPTHAYYCCLLYAYLVLKNVELLLFLRVLDSWHIQGPHSNQTTAIVEHSTGVFGRFRARHNRTASWSEESLGCRTVDLRTSTIKIDAEDRDLRLCFRVISPSKSYTLQVIFFFFKKAISFTNCLIEYIISQYCLTTYCDVQESQ